MKKIFLFSLVSLLFAGVFGLSATNVSAEEGGDQDILQLEIGEEQTKTKIIEDENGQEGTVTITEIPEENDGMVQTFGGSKVISDKLENRSYKIEYKANFGLTYVRYYITVRDARITSARNLDYRLPVSVNNYSLTHSDFLARLDMDVSTDAGGFGTLLSWRGRLSAFIGQGMVYVSWN